MERFGPKENVMSGEKNETLQIISDIVCSAQAMDGDM